MKKGHSSTRNVSTGNAWNSEGSRRLFLKRGGVAGAAAVVGSHSFQVEATAQGSSGGFVRKIVEETFTRNISVTTNDPATYIQNYLQWVRQNANANNDPPMAGFNKTNTKKKLMAPWKKVKKKTLTVTFENANYDPDTGVLTFTVKIVVKWHY